MIAGCAAVSGRMKNWGGCAILCIVTAPANTNSDIDTNRNTNANANTNASRDTITTTGIKTNSDRTSMTALNKVVQYLA